MEKAIIIRRLSDLSDTAEDHDIIYFGNEFCQWLVPGITELREIGVYCRENKKGLALLTPWVTDSGLNSLHDLIAGYLKAEDKLEVVVNDLGVLKMVHDEFGEKADIILGRLLSNQRRDPRTLPLKDIGSKDLYEHYKHSSFDYRLFVDYLKKFDINRVEIDNLVQGIVIPADLEGINFSLHYPYNYITVTRNCAFCYEPGADNPWANKERCKKRCLRPILEMRCDEIEAPLYLKGTAIFIKNDKVEIEGLNQIDRLVYSPYIPI